MRDVRATLVKNFKTALATATDKTIYVRMPKAAGIAYPYIHVGDIYITEDGPKTSNKYNADVQVEVVYKDQLDLTNFYDDIDDIKTVVNNAVPFALDSPFKIISCELINDTTTEIEADSGDILNVGMIRVLFEIVGA